ncbi:MAG: diaminopimelate decarboxylase [Armatimonadetes bacterium]|nr:diaminopimelate decarboxylase [Armatimonadota bacterium]MDW8153545.1 diaminopimelate decarboxylase [Armatimonadota bacterium]
MQDAFGRTPEGHLKLGGCSAVALARTYGTPLTVLDGERLRANLEAYREAFRRFVPAGRPYYASKALCTVGICRFIHRYGFGLDVASGGELYTALRAGVPAQDLCLHGNNKTPEELEMALEAGVGRIVVDNFHELDLLETLTRRRGRSAEIWLRITPGIEPHTHRAIQTGGVDTKFGFGILEGAAEQAVRRALGIPGLRLRGFHSHIGSQILELEPFALNARVVVAFAARMRAELGYTAEELNLGGGLGIRYTAADRPPGIADYVRAVAEAVQEACAEHDFPLPALFLEPGRSVVGPAGVTLYTVGGIKEIPGVRTYVAVDGGMYENPRPALYGARYEAVVADRPDDPPIRTVALAGRCCESGDVLIWEARLPEVRPGDIVAVFATGAYTYAMASNYNRFPRPALVLVEGGRARLVVRRETYEDLLRCDLPLDGEE